MYTLLIVKIVMNKLCNMLLKIKTPMLGVPPTLDLNNMLLEVLDPS